MCWRASAKTRRFVTPHKGVLGHEVMCCDTSRTISRNFLLTYPIQICSSLTSHKRNRMSGLHPYLIFSFISLCVDLIRHRHDLSAQHVIAFIRVSDKPPELFITRSYERISVGCRPPQFPFSLRVFPFKSLGCLRSCWSECHHGNRPVEER